MRELKAVEKLPQRSERMNEARPDEEGLRIVVIGASAGGVEALTRLVGALPEDFPAAVLIVLHLAPQSHSVLPRILMRASSLPAMHPADRTPLRPGMIYVAPPDRHLLVAPGAVRVLAGPKENRHRPAVDPLFRTAAQTYGAQVVGVILTGSGEDGTAGLLEVKRNGGLAIVQHPDDAFSAGMPSSALEFVKVDHCLPLAEIGPFLAHLVHEPLPAHLTGGERENVPERVESPTEESASMPDTSLPEAPEPVGPLEGFTCPHCHGHLWETTTDGFLQFRCRVGHSFSATSLLSGQYDSLEATLWAAMNAFQENAALTRRMAEQAGERGHQLTANRLASRAQDAEHHAAVLREILTSPSLSENGLADPENLQAGGEADADSEGQGEDGSARVSTLR